MNSRKLYLQRIGIYRAPGVERTRGFTLNGLSNRINLVHGSNGSGKTTTARIVQELFWPGEFFADFVSAQGEFVWRDRDWQVELDGKTAVWQCEGRITNPPDFGPREQGFRYFLGLDELIKVDEQGFAKQIADAAQGGFDLKAAADALDYRQNPPSRTRYRNEVEKQRKKVLQAQKNQQSIDARAAQLEELKNKKSLANTAARELEELRIVKDYKVRQSEINELNAKLNRFPQGMDELIGDEPDRLEELKQEKRSFEQKIEQYNYQLELAKQQIEESGLADGGTDRIFLNRLEVLGNKIQDLDREISQLSRERDKAANQEEEVRSRLCSALSGPDLQVLHNVEIKDLGRLARESDKIRARRQILEERKNWLSGKDNSVADSGTVHKGLGILSSWLEISREKNYPRSSRSWMLGLLAILAALTSMLLALQNPAWWVVLPLGPLLAWLISRNKSSNLPDSEQYKNAYIQLDLPQPEDWTSEKVVEAMSNLYELLARAELEREKSARSKALETEEAELEKRESKLREEVRNLEHNLGLGLEIGEEWLSVLADNISRWQQANEEKSREEIALENARTEFQNKLGHFNSQIGIYGYDPVETAEHCKAVVTDLFERRDKYENARNKMDSARQMIEYNLNPALERIEQSLENMFTKVGLASGDEKTLGKMTDRRPEYVELKNELQEKLAVQENLRSQLNDRGLSRLEMSLSEIDGLMDEKKQLAGEHESIVEEITGIQKDIERAKAGGELTSAVACLQQKEDELAQKCEQDLRSVVGNTLTDYVKRKTAERSRPAVFHRASELLGNITKGRYRLEIEEGNEPGFLAFDEVNRRIKNLDELSTGERVQLLLAVRLAFVEHEERDARLPLLMDETLGNADEDRAYAIIQAVIQIAGEGRQVLYFSAQPEEIAKWRQCLESEGMEYAIKDLERLRREREVDNIPLVQPEPNQVPLPDECTHSEYGRILDVPGLDPLHQSVGEVHLWHLIDEPGELYKLLSMGICRVGQAHNLIENGGERVLSGLGLGKQKLQARIRALESCFAVFMIGRSPAVDREVLENSGAVSDTFITEVNQLASRLSGSAEDLLRALEKGQISRWRANKTEELKKYLEEQGYLDPRTPLGHEEIRLEIMGRVARDVYQGLVEVDWLDGLISKLF